MPEAHSDSSLSSGIDQSGVEQRFSLLGLNGSRIALSLLLSAQRWLHPLLASKRRTSRITVKALPRVREAQRAARVDGDPAFAALDTDGAVLDQTNDDRSYDGIDSAVTDEAGWVDAAPEPTGAADRSALSAYLQRLRTVAPLSPEQEAELVVAAQAGDLHALNKLVAHSLHVVPHVAREFANRGLPIEDLIEEGNFGLYRAVAKFDAELGFRFSTYARWWVRHEIRSAVLNKGRLVRLPIHVFRSLSQARRDQSSARGSDSEYRPAGGPIPPISTVTDLPLSLDGPMGEEGSSLVDMLRADASYDPLERLEMEQSWVVLDEALATLSPIERDVIQRRFGLADGEVETLEAIGLAIGLSAERVRQIQKLALSHLNGALRARGIESMPVLR